MFASLLPKSAPFFEMLLEQNSHLRHMSRLLLAMLEDLSKMDEAHKEIALIEEEADKLAAGAHHLLHAGADRRDAGRPDPA